MNLSQLLRSAVFRFCNFSSFQGCCSNVISYSLSVCAVQWLLKPHVDATGYQRRLYQVLISVMTFLALANFSLFLNHKISEND
jgi:hypothetical protein